MKFWVVQSYMYHDVYFVVRNDNTEFKVMIKHNLILPMRNLTLDEMNYFREHILEYGDKRMK